jgi:hypothetical protein
MSLPPGVERRANADGSITITLNKDNDPIDATYSARYMSHGHGTSLKASVSRRRGSRGRSTNALKRFNLKTSVHRG